MILHKKVDRYVPLTSINFCKFMEESYNKYMGFGDYYKGDKKKKKKASGGGTQIAGGPVFVAPTVIPKDKIKY